MKLLKAFLPIVLFLVACSPSVEKSNTEPQVANDSQPTTEPEPSKTAGPENSDSSVEAEVKEGVVGNVEASPAPSESSSNRRAIGTISGGVLNGKAIELPAPVYPPAARAVRASGQVNVQVTVDPYGKVIAASAVSGHPLLRSAAVQAAREAQFTPMILGGEYVRVKGIVTYNFSP